MADEGATTPTRWPRPSALGFAERDPTADVEGYDAAAKAAILAGLAFGATWSATDVYREGITAVEAGRRRLRRPARLRGQAAGGGRAIDDDGRRAGRLACGSTRRWSPPTTRWPRCAARSTPCSSRATAAGELMLYGQGAGGAPTASAVLGDLIDAARNLRSGAPRAGAPRATAPDPPRSTTAVARST